MIEWKCPGGDHLISIKMVREKLKYLRTDYVVVKVSASTKLTAISEFTWYIILIVAAFVFCWLRSYYYALKNEYILSFESVVNEWMILTILAYTLQCIKTSYYKSFWTTWKIIVCFTTNFMFLLSWRLDFLYRKKNVLFCKHKFEIHYEYELKTQWLTWIKRSNEVKNLVCWTPPVGYPLLGIAHWYADQHFVYFVLWITFLRIFGKVA